VTFTATRTATTTPTNPNPGNGGNASISRTDRFRAAQEFSARLDFGDGESIELGAFTSPSTVSHVYTRVGTFTARLVATDVNGDQTTATQIVQVRDSTNSGGSFTVNLALSEPDDDGSATTARLDAAATVSGIGSATVTNYTFSFPGSTSTSGGGTSNQASAVYSSAGDRTVTVTVTLSDGRTATQQATRSVTL
jgi:hypothetical protein